MTERVVGNMRDESLSTVREQGALFEVVNYSSDSGMSTLPTAAREERNALDQPSDTIRVLPPADVLETLRSIKEPVTATILDPWYNKGVGGFRDDYHQWLEQVVNETARISQHIFVWGFPEIVHQVLNYLPQGVSLVAWLTWYYKNCPSVIRGWRSAQLTCLHLSQSGAQLYPEHFLNEKQLEKKAQGKLRYLPGPPSVIETSLLVGFVGKSEQTGHPAQKPMATIEPLVKMTTQEGDLVLDPMCGSGTTAVVCAKLNRRAIVCDESEEWSEVTRRRIQQYASAI